MNQIIEAVTRSTWNPDQSPLKGVLRWLGHGELGAEFALQLALGVLPEIWRSTPLIERKESVTLGILRAVAGRENGASDVRRLSSSIESAFNLDVLNGMKCHVYAKKVIDAYRLGIRTIGKD